MNSSSDTSLGMIRSFIITEQCLRGHFSNSAKWLFCPPVRFVFLELTTAGKFSQGSRRGALNLLGCREERIKNTSGTVLQAFRVLVLTFTHHIRTRTRFLSSLSQLPHFFLDRVSISPLHWLSDGCSFVAASVHILQDLRLPLGRPQSHTKRSITT